MREGVRGAASSGEGDPRRRRSSAGLAWRPVRRDEKARLLLGNSLGGVRRLHEHTALALATVVAGAAAEEDVALEAPRGAPRVLHLVEVSARLAAVAEGGAAGVGGEHTAGVELEAGLVGLDGDGHRLLGHGGHHSVVRVLGDILVAGDGGHRLARAGAAGAVLGLVRVRLLGAKAAVGDDVLEGVVHEAAVAALVAVAAGAVHELLLGEAGELAGGDEGDALSRAGGGERPAGAALALVLDGGHGALGAPVDGGREVHGAEVRELVVLGTGGGAEAADVLGGELLLGEVGELVEAHGPREALGVVGDHLRGVLAEHVEAVWSAPRWCRRRGRTGASSRRRCARG